MPTYLQTDHRQTKADVVFYGESDTSTLSELATDLSGHMSSITVGTSSVYSSVSSRFDISGERTIAFVVGEPADGYLWHHGTGASEEWIRFSGGNLQIAINGASILTEAVTDPAAGERMIVALTTHANPDTTGASDAMFSDVLLIYGTSGTVVRWRRMHPAVTTGSGTNAVFFAADSSGTTPYDGDRFAVLFARRWHTATELWRDFIAANHDQVSGTDDIDVTEPPLPVDHATGFGGSDEFYGPQSAYAAMVTRNVALRTMSPLVNVRMRGELTTASATGPAFRILPDGVHTGMVGWLWCAPVPPGCTHVVARVMATLSVTSGSPVPTSVAVFSMSRVPGAIANSGFAPAAQPQQLDWRMASRKYTADGLLFAIDRYLQVARDSSGRSFFAVGFAFDPDGESSNDANARITIHAVQLRPVSWRNALPTIPHASGLALG